MHEITYLIPDELPTPHPIAPKPSEVFSFELGKLSNCLYPLLTIDLKEFNPAWNQQIHFIYYEHPSIDELIFELDETRYTSIKAVHHKLHQPIAINVENPTEPFKDLSDLQAQPPKELFATFRTYTAGRNITGIYQKAADENFAENAINDYQLIVDNMDLVSEREVYFNPYPIPATHDFIFPCNPDGGQMQFIGQINTLGFGLAAYQYYLFYCPKYHLVKQLVQPA